MNTMAEDTNLQPTSYDLLSEDDPTSILTRLVDLEVCEGTESISQVAKAGEGNMNLVLRVTTDSRSVIVKQARPWVEKYPSIAAPDERIVSEIEFYRCISENGPVRAAMPSVLAFDVEQRLMVLEDLGTASDYAILYRSDVAQSEVDSVFERAINWVSQLHAFDAKDNQNLGCKPLRSLNHQHIFSIPLSDPPAIDLDAVCDGLTKASRAICSDDALRQTMTRLGEIYLEAGVPANNGKVLLHGDYYPGSWLKTEAGFRVIDPEFCFCGPREFDLGVLAAHWIFCGGKADSSTIDAVIQASVVDADIGNQVSRHLVLGFAGAELVRRLTGVAQLPLDADLDRRTQWIDCGVHFLKSFQDSAV